VSSLPVSQLKAEPVTLKSIWGLIRQTASDWADTNPSHLAAALAFYAMLSMAPLLVISMAIAGFVFGRQSASGHIVLQLQNLAGPAATEAIQTVLEHSTHGYSGIAATVTGALVLLFGASSVFGELRDSLNTVWGVKTPGTGWRGIVRYRFFAFSLVLATGFLLLVSLMASAVLQTAGKYFTSLLPVPESLLEGANFLVSLVGITILFGLLYKFVPDVKITWYDVWIGAAVTSLLFTIGKFLIGLYLGRAAVGSPYGAAGSLVVFMAWLNYSAQIFYLGAEFTRIFSERHGSRAHLHPEVPPAASAPCPRPA
jgi:membrane protein